MTAANQYASLEGRLPLRFLHLEDSLCDHKVAQCILAKQGFKFELCRVQTREEFSGAITQQHWDLILADYTLPDFSGDEALLLSRQHCPEVPFVFLAGTLELGKAIETLKHGAMDFVLKHEMERLGMVVRRALAQAQMNRAHQASQIQIKEHEERFLEILHNSSDGIFFLKVLDGGALILEEMNHAAESFYGFSEPQVRGKNFPDLFPPAVTEVLLKDIQTCLESGETVSNESAFPVGKGRTWLQTVLVPLHDSAGRITRIAGFSRNITDRVHAEETKARLETQLRQAQRTQAIGALATGIAHDFNNVLGAISAFAELARVDTRDRPETQENLAQVIQAAERARDLIGQIISFARQTRQERKPQSLQTVLREVLRLLRAILPATIELSANLKPETPRVLAEPTLVHQILMNLCASSAQAMRGQTGKIEIQLDPFNPTPEFIAANPAFNNGRYARLVIRDSGPGLDEATLKHLFELRSLPENGNFGLAVVFSHVKAHEGIIKVESQPGQGTTYQIFFPALVSVGEDTQLLTAQTPKGHGQNILYVDDEEVLCKAISRMLQRLGYRTESTCDPMEALDWFRARPEAFDLVVTDLSMPKLTGVDLAAEIMSIRPGIPILLATGYSGTWTPEMVRSLGIYDVIMKPITFNVLAEAVGGALKSGRTVAAQ